ncbi:MAG: DNA repair protein RadA [Bacteroidetes bacterium]|nr:DNA repair protein RadA [Bacteroidota bacterium]MBU1578181.1 DNA repair protein RadA [Bacteroidota bacterium]MBU2466927.1 DNA repair protein RadA [Bacteroidota bacterium]MBU2557251.1 DNA repair protein RadA [Bacteroidota bacterium]
MAKTKTVFFCKNCGNESPKWIGKCPGCGEWNTYVEETLVTGKRGHTVKSSIALPGTAKPLPVQEISSTKIDRMDMGYAELNRVLGGGLVPGSLVLIGGEPGIGKSTLMLQVALQLSEVKVLYISGEESQQQLKMRADRVGIRNQSCYILTETDTQEIVRHFKEIQPDMVVIDSIQTLQSPGLEATAGSISQIRETAAEMNKLAKSFQVPVFLIGHITKDGSIAGPKILEHMVDTVIQFEGDRHYGFRILRAIKNRFGSAAELGIFEMHANGLREVTNPSEILLSQREEAVSGVAIAAMVEGLRPMLIETQALVSTAAYGTPQRSGTGFDMRRLNMLLAVLEKRAGFRLSAKDVFLNIAGGIRVDDPAIDLSVIASILSSSEDIPIDSKDCFAAEVGLSGEIRAVNRIEARIAEADKLGFERIFISKYNHKGLDTVKYKIEIVAVASVNQLFEALFG